MSSLALMGAGPEAASAFDPLTLSPAVWYDFSTLGLGDGVAIGSIADLSGNARTASQATAGNKPLAKTGANGMNGLAVGLFDGVDDALIALFTTLAQPFVVYAVVQGGAGGAAARYLGTGDATASARAGKNTSPAGPSNFAGAVLEAAAGATATPQQITSVFNGVSSLIRADGSQIVAGDAGAGSLSGGVTLGNSGSALAQPWNGKMGEILVAPGSGVSTAMELRLKQKWGTP